MSKKLTIEYVREQFEKAGEVLLTSYYENNRQKLECVCPKGHKYSISWIHWNSGERCRYCQYENLSKKFKLNFEAVKKSFEDKGYKILGAEYKNNKQKLSCMCPVGHIYFTTWNKWQKGHKCPYCAGQDKPTIEFIKSEFIKEGYILLTKKYINRDQKLEYVCPKKHKHSISWGNWMSGNRCFYCAVDRGADKRRLGVNYIRLEFAKEGYILLTDVYINNSQKLLYICPKGHKHSISWTHWQQGNRCPYCFGNISKSEIEVRNFIESLGIKVLANNRNQIFNPETGCGFELDIFMPDFNKAIEYNGEYWHQDKDRDLLKQQLCKSKEIDLLTIWDKEWKIGSEKCKSKIIDFVFN